MTDTDSISPGATSLDGWRRLHGGAGFTVDPGARRASFRLSPRRGPSEYPGLNSGFVVAHVTAAVLAAENKQRAVPASTDSLPTFANQEDHVSMATHAARHLTAIADNARVIVAIELLAAEQGVDFHAPLASSAVLEKVRAVVRDRVPAMEVDRLLAPDIEAVMELLAAGTFSDFVTIKRLA